MKVIKILRNCLIVMFLSFSANLMSAYATERAYCDLNVTYDKAVTCDYSADGLSNFTSTIAFARKNDGAVCAEVEEIGIKDTGPITNFFQKSVNEQRGLLAFDIEDSTINNALSSNSCPQLKLVNDFDSLKGYTTKVTYSDKITPAVDHVRCFISGNAGTTLNSSQCWLVNGRNFTKITSEEFDDMVSSSSRARASVMDIDPAQVVSNDAGIKKAENGEVGCSIIPPSVMKFMKDTFLFIEIIGIIILAVMSLIEFVKATTASDGEGLTKAIKNTFKRIIIAIILLLLPTLIIWVLNIINANAYYTDSEGKRIIGENGDPLCKNGKPASRNISSSSSSTNYRIKVAQPVISIELDKVYLTLLQGEKVNLNATVRPKSATNKKITWSSSNPNIVSVTAKGKVTAKKAGYATITVKAQDGYGAMARCKISVKSLPTMKAKSFELETQRIGGGIQSYYGVQGFCFVNNYIAMAIPMGDNTVVYLVDKQSFHIYDSISIGNNHANVLSYDPKDRIIFIGNTGQKPITLKVNGTKLSKVKNKTNRAGQILYNEQNDLFMTANGGSIKVYTRKAFYNKGKPMKSFSMSGISGYVPQGKVTYGNHVYYCLSRNSRGKNAIKVYNMTNGKLEQTIYDYTKSDTMAELEQAYFDSAGNMYINNNHGNDFYKTNYNYNEQVMQN